ncbi:hypothetical protein BigBertha_287 [Bacillus phage BigBertha]|uniref:Uncharacterized protein n=1 Tax=Bacillus phage BigBertha TaxID=1406781 RepID=U5PS58_9CAUD|nr:hypothetical protein BigBertha_287 [Bacillus phage BigBertha]AGY46795.1 hypothetical protein BigBertha_287 [Bacillus phage BigBertha]
MNGFVLVNREGYKGLYVRYNKDIDSIDIRITLGCIDNVSREFSLSIEDFIFIYGHLVELGHLVEA